MREKEERGRDCGLAEPPGPMVYLELAKGVEPPTG